MNIATALEAQKTENRRKYLAILANADSADAKTLAKLDELRIALALSTAQVQKDLNDIHELQRLHEAANGGDGASQCTEDADAADRAEAAVAEGIEERKQFLADWAKRQTARITAAQDARNRASENGRSARQCRLALADAKKARPDLAEALFNSEPTPRTAA